MRCWPIIAGRAGHLSVLHTRSGLCAAFLAAPGWFSSPVRSVLAGVLETFLHTTEARPTRIAPLPCTSAIGALCAARRLVSAGLGDAMAQHRYWKHPLTAVVTPGPPFRMSPTVGNLLRIPLRDVPSDNVTEARSIRFLRRPSHRTHPTVNDGAEGGLEVARTPRRGLGVATQRVRQRSDR